MPAIVPGIEASFMTRLIASSSRATDGALTSALVVADLPEGDGTADEHPASAAITMAIIATATGRCRRTQNRLHSDLLISGSYR
jgi:hypothetical protein